MTSMCKWTCSFIVYLTAYVVSLHQLNYCSLIFLIKYLCCFRFNYCSEIVFRICLPKFAESIENIKYCIKLCIVSLEHCVSCQRSPNNSLYSLKLIYSNDRCGKVSEPASVYLISMFCSCSTPNRLSYKTNFKIIINYFLPPFQNLLMRFITNTLSR